MIIEKHRVGAHGRKTIYTICNSIAETGESRTDEIARFDTLELAAIVLRYLRGDSLSEADEYRAKEAIKKADTDRKAPLTPIIARAGLFFKIVRR